MVEEFIRARVVYDPAGDQFVGTVLATGETFVTPEIRELAELLFAVGVRHSEVSMPDWREGDIAPAAGDKIALNQRLNALGRELEEKPTILVIDLEATCNENDPAFDMETIEIGACWIAADGSVLDRFQSFVRPIVNPQLTPFCTQLIGITQADVDAAPLFPVAADALRAFVARHQQTGSVWMSWGTYDRKQFERDSARHGISAPVALPHENAKRRFAKAQRIGKEVGMARACAIAGLQLTGTHHRALDDALNVARLLPWVLGKTRCREPENE